MRLPFRRSTAEPCPACQKPLDRIHHHGQVSVVRRDWVRPPDYDVSPNTARRAAGMHTSLLPRPVPDPRRTSAYGDGTWLDVKQDIRRGDDCRTFGHDWVLATTGRGFIRWEKCSRCPEQRMVK